MGHGERGVQNAGDVFGQTGFYTADRVRSFERRSSKGENKSHTPTKFTNTEGPLTLRCFLFLVFRVKCLCSLKLTITSYSKSSAHYIIKNSVGFPPWLLHKHCLFKTARVLDLALSIRNNQNPCG